MSAPDVFCTWAGDDLLVAHATADCRVHGGLRRDAEVVALLDLRSGDFLIMADGHRAVVAPEIERALRTALETARQRELETLKFLLLEALR